MIEYVAVGLGVIAGVCGVLAWVYHRGVNSGIDSACEKRIKDKIEDVGKKVDDHMEDDRKTHKDIFDKIDEVKTLIIQKL